MSKLTNKELEQHSWRDKETPFTKRQPGEYRPGKTKRDQGKRNGRRSMFDFRKE